jgi:hypothetical protein
VNNFLSKENVDVRIVEINQRKGQPMKISRIIVLMAIFALLGQNIFGQIETLTFDGTVTQGLAGSPYQANLPYSVYFDVDTTRLSIVASGLYYPTVGYGFNESSLVGPVGFGASSVGSAVLIANDQPLSGGGSYDGIVFSMFGEGSTSFPFDGSAFGITLVNDSAGPTATPFINTSFPTTLKLNQFSQRYMSVYFESGTVRGSVDSFYVNGILISQVPEPSFFGLYALTGLVLTCNYFCRCKSIHRKTLPNKSPEPTAVAATVAIHATSRRWLSFLR